MFLDDIENECQIVVENTDIQYLEMVDLSKNAVTQSFADEGTKKMLMDGLDAELAVFEGKRGGAGDHKY